MRRNRAVAGYNRAQMFTPGSVYEMPFGPGRKLATSGPVSWIVRDWQANGSAGTPFTISANGTELHSRGNTQTADPRKAGKVQVNGETGANKAWFDPLAFKQPTGAGFGTTGRNTLFGAGIFNAGMSLFRTFRLTEKARMEFKAECFNVTNTPKVANPGSNVSSMALNGDGSIRALNNFASITNTLGGLATPPERQFRFGPRLGFQRKRALTIYERMAGCELEYG